MTSTAPAVAVPVLPAMPSMPSMPPLPTAGAPVAQPTLEQEMRQSALLFGMLGLAVLLAGAGVGVLAGVVALARTLA